MLKDFKKKIFFFAKFNIYEILIFCSFLSIYIYTSSRTLVYGDTGEFLAVAAVGGVAHDPGFPLYSLLTRVVFLLFHDSWAVNILSCFFGALTLIFVYKLIKLITGNIFASFFGVFALGTYESFWFYSLVAQVYVLHVLILSLFFYFLAKIFYTQKMNYFYLCAFILGLGISNHHAIIFVVPSFVIALIYFKRKITWAFLLKMFIFLCIGLLPYLYIIWAASGNPPLNWGRIHDVKSFFNVFFRVDYGTLNLTPYRLSFPFEDGSFIYLFENLIKNTWYVVIFSLISLYYLYKKNLYFLLFFLGFILSGPFYYYLMSQPVYPIISKVTIEQFLSYPFYFIAVFSGIGLNLLYKRVKFANKRYLFVLFLFIFIFPFINNFTRVRQDNNNLVVQTTKYVFSELPKNSIILTAADSLYFPGLYLRYLDNYRPDIKIIDVTILSDWYIKNFTDLYPGLSGLFDNSKFDFDKTCLEYAKDNKLYIYPWFPDFDTYFDKYCKVIPYGLVAKVVLKNTKIDLNEIKKFNDNSWNNFEKKVSIKSYRDSTIRDREGLNYLAEEINYQGLFYERNNKENWAIDRYQLAQKISKDEINSIVNEGAIYFKRNDLQKSLGVMKTGLENGSGDSQLYFALGFLYIKLNNQDRAYFYFKKYLEFNPPDSIQVESVRNFVVKYESTM